MQEKAKLDLPSPAAVKAAIDGWKRDRNLESKAVILSGIRQLSCLAYRFEPEGYALPLYRVVKEKLMDQDRNRIATFSYPPADKCMQARANLAGCPVFYVADNPVTALRESDCPPEEIVYLSKWQFRQPRNALIYLFLNEEQNHPAFWTPILAEREQLLSSAARRSPAQEESLKELYYLYWSVFTGEAYDLSALIGHYLLYDHPEPVDILLYPSLADEKRSCNLAIATRFADAHFKLAKVYRLKIGTQEDFSDAALLEVGVVRKESIVWRKIVNGHQKIDSVLRSHTYREEREQG